MRHSFLETDWYAANMGETLLLERSPAQASRLLEASERNPRRPNAPDLTRGSRAAAPTGSDEASPRHGIT